MKMKTLVAVFSIPMLVGVLGCSSGSGSEGGNGSGSGGDSGTSASGSVTEVAGSVMVPASFAGTPAKVIFGYGKKQITDGNGKMINIPMTFLPSLAGIANPSVTAGKAYEMDMKGVSIPEGDYYVLVALYVQGTSGTIPEQGKDFIAGTTTTVHFSGAKVTLPALTFQVSQGTS